MINMSDINIRRHFGSSQASNIISIPKSRSYPGVLLRFTLLPLLPQLPRGSFEVHTSPPAAAARGSFEVHTSPPAAAAVDAPRSMPA